MTTAQRSIRVVLDKMSFLECPRWHQGRLWVSDFYTNQVLATDIEGNAEVMATVPGQPSGLGFLPDGRALIVSMSDRRLLVRGEDGELTEHADLSGLVQHHLNDMMFGPYSVCTASWFGMVDIQSKHVVRVLKEVMCSPTESPGATPRSISARATARARSRYRDQVYFVSPSMAATSSGCSAALRSMCSSIVPA